MNAAVIDSSNVPASRFLGTGETQMATFKFGNKLGLVQDHAGRWHKLVFRGLRDPSMRRQRVQSSRTTA